MSIRKFVEMQQAELARKKQALQATSAKRDKPALGKEIRDIEGAIRKATRRGLQECS